MLDFDEESKRTESEEVAANGKAPDKIDDEYDYEAKYEKTYAQRIPTKPFPHCHCSR